MVALGASSRVDEQAPDTLLFWAIASTEARALTNLCLFMDLMPSKLSGQQLMSCSVSLQSTTSGSGVKPLAKPSFGGHVRGFYRRAADDGPSHPYPHHTSRGGMPRPAKFFTVQHQNPSIPRSSIRTISSKMATTKDYRLLCLENPLLGMYTSNFSRLETQELPIDPRTTPLSHVVVPDRGLGEAPAIQVSPCQYVNSPSCPKPTANPSPSQTSKPSATMRSSPSTASRPTTLSSPRRSTRASLRTCSTTTTPS
jgi:hypothetical protein